MADKISKNNITILFISLLIILDFQLKDAKPIFGDIKSNYMFYTEESKLFTRI